MKIKIYDYLNLPLDKYHSKENQNMIREAKNVFSLVKMKHGPHYSDFWIQVFLKKFFLQGFYVSKINDIPLGLKKI